MSRVSLIICIGCFGALLFGATASAAPHRISAKPHRLGEFIRSGAIIGGEVGEGFSILRLSVVRDSSGTEKIAILYGDAHGRPVKSKPGYFHIEVDEKIHRVAIDLTQVQKTAVEPERLAKIFRVSKLVSSTEMTMDPIDASTNLVLSLRQAAEVRARQETIEGVSALVIELRPDGRG